jgi:hypothetical protein
MTRTISLIIGIATVALVVAVPTALGKGSIGGLQVQEDTTYVDANERATLVNSSQQPALGAYTDANERGGVRPSGIESTLAGYVDANERVVVPPASVTQVSATGSDSDVQWPQIGIGFGVGILLALGLFLALKATRIRPLAH